MLRACEMDGSHTINAVESWPFMFFLRIDFINLHM